MDYWQGTEHEQPVDQPMCGKDKTFVAQTEKQPCEALVVELSMIPDLAYFGSLGKVHEVFLFGTVFL